MTSLGIPFGAAVLGAASGAVSASPPHPRWAAPRWGGASWGPPLGPARGRAVPAYVVTLRGTNVAGGKAAQGERETLSLNP